MFDNARVVLGAGAVLACGSEGDVWVALDDERVTLSYPEGGLGGGELVVAPDGRHAALWIYSGQSEVGYELFSLVPALRHLGGLPYVLGEGAAPVWSPDSRFLAMLVGTSPAVHGSGASVEDLLDPHAQGELDVDIAELVVQDVTAGTPPARATIHARIPASLDPDVFAEWTFYDPVRFAGDARVGFSVPWGAEVEVDLPPPRSIRAPDYEA